MEKILRATAEASPNIAIIKYWGKRDEKLILPMNESISVTLDEELKTKSTVMFSERFKKDEVYLGYSEGINRLKHNKEIKRLRTKEELEKIIPQLDVIRKIADIDLRARVASVSFAPVAGGLAGSAAGLCATAFSATSALGLKLTTKELSIICRRGSGSACRSVYGGFVEWKKGIKKDGRDSFAVQLKDENFWPEFRIVIGICEEKEKKVKSRAGMRQTILTSSLYKKRLKDLPQLIKETKEAIFKKDHQKLFEIAMMESDNLHSVMLDTWPPIIYLNDISKKVIYSILEYNKTSIKAGYTFDAGSNPVVFTLKRYENDIEKILKQCGIKKIIISRIGLGPKVLEKTI